MSLDFTDDQSTLVQVMAWCRQATSHYLSQCWPRSLSPYDITRPQWVNTWGAIRFCEILSAMLNDVVRSMTVRRNHWQPEKFWKNMSIFSVRIVLADGLAPLGARPSASTVVTKFGSRSYKTTCTLMVNTLRSGQNGWLLAEDIFKCIFF